MKNNKGITLIALIITIIVMLILVVVTVTVALEGGLFSKAKEAAEKTEPQAIYETIVSAMILTDDGKINVKATAEGAKTAIEQDKTKQGTPERPTTISPNPLSDNAEKATLTVTGKYGTYEYEITGEKIAIKNGEDTPWYILTDREKGEIENTDSSLVTRVTTPEESQAMGGMPVGTEMYMVAYDSVNGYAVQYVEVNQDGIGYIIVSPFIMQYMAMDEDTYNAMASQMSPQDLPIVNTWSYAGEIEYTLGTCPYYFDEFDSNEIYCTSYFNRVKAQFAEYGWYDVRKEEAQEIKNSSKYMSGIYIIACDNENDPSNAIYAQEQNDYLPVDRVIVNKNGDYYIYMVEEHKWYKATNSNFEPMSRSSLNPSYLVEETPTLTKNTYTYIYSEDYLDRMLAHYQD